MTNVSGVARLGTNPELKMVGPDKDKAVCEFRVSMTNGRYDQGNENWIDQSYWADVSVWGKMAEVVARMFTKGDRIYIDGTQHLHKWQHEDKDYSTFKIDSRLVFPHTLDIENMQYKPRKNKTESSAGSQNNSTPDNIPFQNTAAQEPA